MTAFRRRASPGRSTSTTFRRAFAWFTSVSPRTRPATAFVDQFVQDAAGSEAAFPAFCFIEPNYNGADENDDHPPHDVMKAQKFLAEVYNAIRANADLWNSTLLVVLYDEHGGFYDHV